MELEVSVEHMHLKFSLQKEQKKWGTFPPVPINYWLRAVIEDGHYGAALPACSIHWQSEFLVSRKALRQVMQMLVGREQAEVPFTQAP